MGTNGCAAFGFDCGWSCASVISATKLVANNTQTNTIELGMNGAAERETGLRARN
jgi:hypothetical protein